MATGLPVIATYHSGIPYVVKDNETGLLVHEWDIDSLCDCILKLISSSELRIKLGSSAQQFVLKELSSSIKAKELEEIYLKAIDQFQNL